MEPSEKHRVGSKLAEKTDERLMNETDCYSRNVCRIRAMRELVDVGLRKVPVVLNPLWDPESDSH